MQPILFIGSTQPLYSTQRSPALLLESRLGSGSAEGWPGNTAMGELAGTAGEVGYAEASMTQTSRGGSNPSDNTHSLRKLPMGLPRSAEPALFPEARFQ